MKPLSVASVLIIVSLAATDFASAASRELKVHLAQANNECPYAFVRAKFAPDELTDPWAVRFFDAAGREVPYFVWDSMTWREAREGRADWGRRYAPLNHAAGDAPDVKPARDAKISWAVEHLPELGEKLRSQDDAARASGESVCAAMYLLRYRVAAFGKERLALHIHDQRQVEPRRKVLRNADVSER